MLSSHNVTYKQLFRLSLPIMIGSAVQNSIALSDSAFLLYYDQTDFAAIGIVSVFYLIVAAIGYGFSKGGQIMVARRMGVQGETGLGSTLTQMILFQGILGVFMLVLLYAGGYFFLSLCIENPILLDKCWEYLSWRSWSVIFSYVGLAFIGFYTGISRTWFIVFDVAILLIVNIILNYGFIFGAFGLPEMGIAGAGLASALAELVAFVIFIWYVVSDKNRKTWSWSFEWMPDRGFFQTLIRIGFPVVLQMIVSLASWFVFFSLIETYGEKALAVSNLSRMAYLFFSIPVWGFSSGINTVASFLIGQNAFSSVLPTIRKMVILSIITTLVIALPVLISPIHTLNLLQVRISPDLIEAAAPILQMILIILIVYCIGAIYYNGLVGTGDTLNGLYIQIFGVFAYIVYIYAVIKVFSLPLIVAWTGELFFWCIIILFTTLYLRSGRWKTIKL